MADPDARLACLLVGARIGDSVGDLQWALQELGEVSPSTEEHTSAMAVLDSTSAALDEAVGQAHRTCGGLPDDLLTLWQEFGKAKSTGDLVRMRAWASDLSDKLGTTARGEG